MTEGTKEACEVMTAGGIILYPTDTIWGIGCNATNEKAVQRAYEPKRRTDNEAMLVLMDSEAKLDRYVSDVLDIVWDLISVSDKPLTIIYSSAKNLATSLLGAGGSVGTRITNEEFSKKLCERFRKPLASTPANVSGEPSPANFSEVSEVIKEGVDYVVSYRRDDMSKAVPSGIIKLGADGPMRIIR